ncbi:peptidylprolyl isomerase [Pararhodobacter sp. SW119]|uniref:peptidylprolyl isomerase n=1 Tax=Pararhodobacter sp. SW119 TaxID=2780075 RepID=UPI001ADF148B|nr:peptidylprolyl isomerase [Pararhodobacter sp. SW119]
MRDRFLFAGLFALGFAVLGAYAFNAAQGQAQTAAPEDAPVLEITVAGQAEGVIEVTLRPDLAPQHVERVIALAESGAYDGVVFHRVIDGFMAQTGDVQFGRAEGDTARAGTGGSDMPNLPAEFSDEPFARGVMGMARSQSPDSANSQFFLMFAPAPHLNGQYTVLGQITDGMDVLDAIKRGTGPNGAVMGAPDIMERVRVLD